MASKSYSPASVTLIVGVYQIQGFDEDSMVEISPMAEEFTSKAGADGEVTTSQILDRREEVTITLMETSESNAHLDSLLASQRALPGTAKALTPFTMMDSLSGETVSAAECIITGRPAVGKSKEAGTREWKLLLPYPARKYAA